MKIEDIKIGMTFLDNYNEMVRIVYKLDNIVGYENVGRMEMMNSKELGMVNVFWARLEEINKAKWKKVLISKLLIDNK